MALDAAWLQGTAARADTQQYAHYEQTGTERVTHRLPAT